MIFSVNDVIMIDMIVYFIGNTFRRIGFFTPKDKIEIKMSIFKLKLNYSNMKPQCTCSRIYSTISFCLKGKY